MRLADIDFDKKSDGSYGSRKNIRVLFGGPQQYKRYDLIENLESRFYEDIDLGGDKNCRVYLYGYSEDPDEIIVDLMLDFTLNDTPLDYTLSTQEQAQLSTQIKQMTDRIKRTVKTYPNVFSVEFFGRAEEYTGSKDVVEQIASCYTHYRTKFITKLKRNRV